MSDVPQDAAPSSTEPQQPAPEVAQVGEPSTNVASQSSSGEAPNVVDTPPAGAVIAASTEGDVPNDVSGAGAPTAVPDSASNAAGGNTTLPSDASSAEPPTLEQRVADLERALVSLPHSIATVMHRGSMGADDFAKAVIAHLFGKE